jgi:hypothetical protein
MNNVITKRVENLTDKLYEIGVQMYGLEEFDKMLNEEIQIVTNRLIGFPIGRTNITINMLKKYQNDPTQQKLDSVHIFKTEKNSNDSESRDINLYKQLSDFIDLLKPKNIVVIKFEGEPRPIFCQYKKTQTQNLDWLRVWYEDFPECIIEYCTDVHNYLRIMGPACSLVNISNLLNRIESDEINYTLILLALTIFPETDISPITRNATIENKQILKSVMYEDVQRKILRIENEEDDLTYSRSRNMFNLPALSGTNVLI